MDEQWYYKIMKNLGNKIVVVGVSATGKSTFTRKLAQKIKVFPVFVDAIMWKPGWNYIGDEETAKKLIEISDGSQWIIEGYLVEGAKEIIFNRADSIIYLDYSPIVAVLRYIKRYWKHRVNPRTELDGSPEKFSWKMLKRIWQKREVMTLDKFLDRSEFNSKVTRLHSPKETRLFLENI